MRLEIQGHWQKYNLYLIAPEIAHVVITTVTVRITVMRLSTDFLPTATTIPQPAGVIVVGGALRYVTDTITTASAALMTGPD